MLMNSSDSMHMTFYVGSNAQILFTGWHTTSWQGMLGSCFVLIAMTLVYEAIKVGRPLLREYVVKQSRNFRENNGRNDAQIEDEPMIVHSPLFYTERRLLWAHFAAQTALYMFQIVIGYLLMLVVMSYNVWLFISIVFGAGLGYFLFNLKSLTAEITGGHCE